MRTVHWVLLTAGVLLGAGTAEAQNRSPITPPRLRVTFRQERRDTSRVDQTPPTLQVDGVAPDGLGQQLGLRPGDILKSLQVNKGQVIDLTTQRDLARALEAIRDATLN